tara:strand:+ start:678 stop:1529 length:852 start_codon:yes stop_codon:yes gene_type:complete
VYPIIYDFGVVDLFGFQFRLAIYSFGLMLVIAFYACYFLLEKDLKELGHDEKLASDIIFWSALGGIIGSKIYHVIENLDQILASSNPLSMIFSGSGLVFLGGLIGAVVAVTIVLNKYEVSWLKFADRLAPLILLGYAIGRLGCFLVGDDYGIPSSLPWAMSFPEGLPATTTSVFEYQFPWVDISGLPAGVIKVHPTQMYETLICSILFYLLWSKRNNILVPGSLFFQYLILAGSERFIIEFLRTNEKYVFDIFSGAQILSILMIIIGSYFLLNPISDGNTDTT